MLTQDAFTRSTSHPLRFGFSVPVTNPAETRQALLMMSVDDELPVADVLRLLQIRGLDLDSPVTPKNEPFLFDKGVQAQRVEGAKANTPLGLLYIAAVVGNNTDVLDALKGYVQSHLHSDKTLRALGGIVFHPSTVPAPSRYIQLIQTLATDTDPYIRENIAAGLGSNPNPQLLPEPLIETMQTLAADPDRNVRNTIAFELGGNPNPQQLPEPLIKAMQTLASDPEVSVRNGIAASLGSNPNPHQLPVPLIELMRTLARHP